ncbi:TPA: hypothetical protein ACJI3N_004073 [Raoultella planticola]
MKNNKEKYDDTTSEEMMVSVLKEMGCREELQKTEDGKGKIRDYNHVFIITDQIITSRKEKMQYGHHYVHVRRFTNDRYLYQFVIYPFKANKFYPIIKNIKGIRAGKARSLSGFTTYPKIDKDGKIKDEGGKASTGLGYSFIIFSDEGLRNLVNVIRKGIKDSILDKEFDKNKIRQDDDLDTHFRSMKALS